MPNNNPANIAGLKDLAVPGVKILMGTKELPAGDYARSVLDNFTAAPEFGPAFKEATLTNVVSQDNTVNRIVSNVALEWSRCRIRLYVRCQPSDGGQGHKDIYPLQI